MHLGIRVLLLMKHHQGPDPGLAPDRDLGQGQEVGLHLDQDPEAVEGSVLSFPMNSLFYAF